LVQNQALRPTQLEPAVCGKAGMITWQKLGELTDISRDTLALILGLTVFADAWLEISADL